MVLVYNRNATIRGHGKAKAVAAFENFRGLEIIDPVNVSRRLPFENVTRFSLFPIALRNLFHFTKQKIALPVCFHFNSPLCRVPPWRDLPSLRKHYRIGRSPSRARRNHVLLIRRTAAGSKGFYNSPER